MNIIITIFVSLVTLMLLTTFIKLKNKNKYLIINLKKKLLPIFPELKFVNVVEGGKSYIANKHNIYLCVDKNRGTTYNKKILTFVLLHELAHSLNSQIGHGDKFQDIFDSLLKRAKDNGIDFDVVNPEDYIYCK